MAQNISAISDNDENIIKILIASDIHLGHKEKDPIIGNDSFVAFEEVLQHAVTNGVDAIILGGDLFDIANPTTNTLNRCMKLLRNYTLGDKPISLEFLSDQTLNFNQTVNYEDPNINVSIPVFSIHGNHDDPSGFGRISSLDLLATTGLVNYFGRWTDLTQITINPILLQKGETRMALYGLSYISDKRLARLFLDANVKMAVPDGKWFNLMVLHQNRADRGIKNYLPEKSLPNFLDLVIWGHEHDCRIIPEQCPERGFFVCQPGSTVPTSLAEGEATPKHCALLKIYKEKFFVEPIKLLSTRPFIFKTIDVTDFGNEIDACVGEDEQQKLQEFARVTIERMIEESKNLHTGYQTQPTLPLIRLRILLTSYEQQFNTIRFGQFYTNRVANPLDMVMFKKPRSKKEQVTIDGEKMKNAYDKKTTEQESNRPEEIVEKYFDDADEVDKLEFFSAKVLSECCRRMVDHDDDDAAERIIDFYLKEAVDYLNKNATKEEDAEDCLVQFKANEENLFKDALTMLDQRAKKFVRDDVDHNSDEDDYADEPRINPVVNTSVAKNTTTTRGGRGSRGSRGRGSKASTSSVIIDDDKEPDFVPVVTKPTRGRGSRGGGVRGGSSRGSKVDTSAKKPTLAKPSPLASLFQQQSQRSSSSRTAANKQPIYIDSDDD